MHQTSEFSVSVVWTLNRESLSLAWIGNFLENTYLNLVWFPLVGNSKYPCLHLQASQICIIPLSLESKIDHWWICLEKLPVVSRFLWNSLINNRSSSGCKCLKTTTFSCTFWNTWKKDPSRDWSWYFQVIYLFIQLPVLIKELMVVILVNVIRLISKTFLPWNILMIMCEKNSACIIMYAWTKQ